MLHMPPIRTGTGHFDFSRSRKQTVAFTADALHHVLREFADSNSTASDSARAILDDRRSVLGNRANVNSLVMLER